MSTSIVKRNTHVVIVKMYFFSMKSIHLKVKKTFKKKEFSDQIKYSENECLIMIKENI